MNVFSVRTNHDGLVFVGRKALAIEKAFESVAGEEGHYNVSSFGGKEKLGASTPMKNFAISRVSGDLLRSYIVRLTKGGTDVHIEKWEV